MSSLEDLWDKNDYVDNVPFMTITLENSKFLSTLFIII